MEETNFLGIIPVVMGVLAIVVSKFASDDFFNSRWTQFGMSRKVYFGVGILSIIAGLIILSNIV